jgi:hypothetical protein
MRPKHFFAGLAITSIVQIIICLLLMWMFDRLRAHSGFIATTIVAMIFFSITIFGAAKVYAKSSLVRLYIQLVMIAVFLKLLLCLALVIGYKKEFNPADHAFIWPFLIIYLTSTIYEVIFMERVGREKPVSKS